VRVLERLLRSIRRSVNRGCLFAICVCDCKGASVPVATCWCLPFAADLAEKSGMRCVLLRGKKRVLPAVACLPFTELCPSPGLTARVPGCLILPTATASSLPHHCRTHCRTLLVLRELTLPVVPWFMSTLECHNHGQRKRGNCPSAAAAPTHRSSCGKSWTT
jgi:hypothetical protein